MYIKITVNGNFIIIAISKTASLFSSCFPNWKVINQHQIYNSVNSVEAAQN